MTAGLLAVFSLAACGAEPCEDDISGELPSPDGKFVAALLIRTCDEAYPINVDGKETMFAKAVLMRLADSDSYGDEPLTNAIHIVDGDWPLTFRWIDAT